MSNEVLIDGIVYGVERCPQCGVATPLLEKTDKAHKHHVDTGYNPQEYWYFTARCSRCHHHVLFYGKRNKEDGNRDEEAKNLFIIRSFPQLERAAQELPPMATRFYQQALESRHAPDGALMLAASAIDAMLKDKGYVDGNLFNRIKEANVDGLLTSGMASWAHEIRLNANEPRHADKDSKGASPDDADQILEFAKALGDYLYVLPARVEKWQEKALKIETK